MIDITGGSLYEGRAKEIAAALETFLDTLGLSMGSLETAIIWLEDVSTVSVEYFLEEAIVTYHIDFQKETLVKVELNALSRHERTLYPDRLKQITPYQNADAIQRLEELGLLDKLDKQKFYFNLDKVEFSS